MSDTLCRWLRGALLTTLGTASAAPFLPSSNLAAQAVRDALTAEPHAAVQAQTPAPTAAAASRSGAVAPRAVTQKAAVQRVTVQKVAVQKTVTQKAVVQKAVTQKPVARKTVTPKVVVKKQAAKPTAAQVRARGVQLAQTGAQTARAPAARSVVARATAYNSMPGQTDSTPFITATGTRTRPGVVALSRDLLRVFPYGSKVMIEDLTGRSGTLLQNRVFYVEDTMAAYKTRSVDIWMASYSQAIRFGARQVRITAVR